MKYESCKSNRQYLVDAQGGEAQRLQAADCPAYQYSINILDGTLDKAPIVAADTIGAGVGETVIVVGGSSARSAAGDMSVPVDATVVGIVDDQEIDPGVLQ